MIKKTVNFTNFDGEADTADLWFHLTKAEATKLQTSVKGGYANYIEEVVKSKDTDGLLNIMCDVINLAHGERTADGKFRKSKDISESFQASEEFSELLMGFLNNPDDFKDFVEKLIPKVENNEVKEVK